MSPGTPRSSAPSSCSSRSRGASTGRSYEEYTRETTLELGDSPVYDELAVVEVWKHLDGQYSSWDLEVYPASSALRNTSARIFQKNNVPIGDLPEEIIEEALDEIESEIKSLDETISEKKEERKKWRHSRAALKNDR